MTIKSNVYKKLEAEYANGNYSTMSKSRIMADMKSTFGDTPTVKTYVNTWLREHKPIAIAIRKQQNMAVRSRKKKLFYTQLVISAAAILLLIYFEFFNG